LTWTGRALLASFAPRSSVALCARRRGLAKPPDQQAGEHPDRIGQSLGRDPGAEFAIVAIGGIGQHHDRREAGAPRSPQLRQRDLRLGLEGSVRRHADLGPPVGIIRPVLRQVELVGDRQAGLVGGHRKADRDLAIVLLAALAAILPRYADRVLALLGIAGVVDDQRLDRFLAGDDRQHLRAHFSQYCRVGPGACCDKMQQRLMLRRGALRRGQRCQRLDALATFRRQQADAVVLERPDPVGVAQPRCQLRGVGLEADFRAAVVLKTQLSLPRKVW
jgi:hypothetical protein